MQTNGTVAIAGAARHSLPWRRQAGSGIGDSCLLINQGVSS